MSSPRSNIKVDFEAAIATATSRAEVDDFSAVQAICRPRERAIARVIGDRIVGVVAARKPRAKAVLPTPVAPVVSTPATNRTVDAWHSWRQCPPPPDLVREIEEIARHRQCRPRKVLWQLVREALRQRSGRH